MADLTRDDPKRLGRYRVLKRLAAGGMGVVYLGRSRGGEFVAIKVIRPEFAHDDEYRRRFRREVEAARSVGGRCTARVLDADLDADRAFLVTEFVPGPNLYRSVHDYGPLQHDRLNALALGLAEALAAIHGAGIAHRDVKPANVILGPTGPKVIDFGIARVDDATAMTRTGLVLGTPGWTAPEHLQGRPATEPADVFAWASTVLFAATGRPPFGEGNSAAVLHRTLNEEPDLEPLGEPLGGLVGEALAKDPDARPTSRDLATRLARQLGAPPDTVLAEQVSTVLARTWIAPEQLDSRPAPGRTWTWRIAVGAAILAFIGLTAAGLAMTSGSPPRPGHAAASQTTDAPSSVSTSTATAALTTTSAQSAQEIAARQVEVCEAQHQLGSNRATLHPSEGQTVFASCDWPPSTGAGNDGFTQISITEGGTGLPESSDASSYDLVSGPCSAFRLGYSFGSQGDHRILPTFTAAQGLVTQEDHPGVPYSMASQNFPTPPPYPGRGQILYLHNSSEAIDDAACTA